MLCVCACVCLWLAGVLGPVLHGLRSIGFLSYQVENFFMTWTGSPGRRTGLDTPAVQSSVKAKETLELRGNVFEGFVRDSV